MRRVFLLFCLALPALSRAQTAADRDLQLARSRAETHLRYARQGSWEKAADGVVVVTSIHSSLVQIPLDTPSAPHYQSFRKQAIKRLRQLYSHVKPGMLVGPGRVVAVDPANDGSIQKNGRRIAFSYKHDDLDGLEMLQVGPTWYRVLEIY